MKDKLQRSKLHDLCEIQHDSACERGSAGGGGADHLWGDDEVADLGTVSSTEEAVNIVLAHVASPAYSGDTVAFAVEFTGKCIAEFICRST